MNEVKKVILFLLCCAIPFSFYAQKARQNAVTKKWGYEQTENKGWWENSKYRGNSMFGGWDAALVRGDQEIYRKVGRSSFRRKSRFYRHTQSFYN